MTQAIARAKPIPAPLLKHTPGNDPSVNQSLKQLEAEIQTRRDYYEVGGRY